MRQERAVVARRKLLGIEQKLLRVGEAVRLGSVDEDPPEAEGERERSENAGETPFMHPLRLAYKRERGADERHATDDTGEHALKERTRGDQEIEALDLGVNAERGRKDRCHTEDKADQRHQGGSQG